MKCPQKLPTSYEIMIDINERNSCGNYYESCLIKNIGTVEIGPMANATKI
jgi:hypothetical protein